MNYLAIAVLIIAAIIWVLWAIGTMMSALLKATADWLGRKGIGLKASIPDELSPTGRPLPPEDVEKDRLMHYRASESPSYSVRAAQFQGTIDNTLVSIPEPTLVADVAEVAGLVAISPELPYEPFFASVGCAPSYPIPPPNTPVPVNPPPSWKPWSLTLRMPSFSPPYYGPWLAFLNEYVDAVYSPEVEKVRRAIQYRDDLLARCAQRNAKVAELAANAKAGYESAVSRQVELYSRAMAEHAQNRGDFEKAFNAEQSKLVEWRASLSRRGQDGLLARIEASLRTAKLPEFVSREGRSRLDADSGILIHEHRFPDLSALRWLKRVQVRSRSATWRDAEWVIKAANQKERKDAALKLYPSLCLRLACELARLDTDGIVTALVINGWADYTEKTTGQPRRAYCVSLLATKEQLQNLHLEAVDPIEAFAAMKGRAARSLEVTPISPVIRFDTNDARFVDGKEVLGKMSQGENLAAMDWEDFEHLCRQLFEKAFAASGAEVKITQVSRDRGVDAIIFDPDPLRGGKIVIQAKRYTGTIDVAAVRDLYGTVHNEGAIKGILVTTSHFGVDSYTFVKDKPLTLLDGSQLLGLLEQHGYKFRIDLEEAKRFL